LTIESDDERPQLVDLGQEVGDVVDAALPSYEISQTEPVSEDHRILLGNEAALAGEVRFPEQFPKLVTRTGVVVAERG
jgi:hypothetical protein